jgi:alanine-synthesizing transaminase
VFSKRTTWDLEQNALSQLLAAKRMAGTPLLDLTLSNPTTAEFEYPRMEILAALADPGQLRYAPTPAGAAGARAAIVTYYQQRGADLDPDQILLTASTSEAYAWTFKLLADPGDTILIPQPSYPLFEYLAGLEGIRAATYPLRYDGEWHIDFPALAACKEPRVRAIVVVHPNNPTGSFLKQEEYRRLAAFCRDHELAIICDEVFSDYAYAPDAQRMGTLAGADEVLTCTLSGLSKVAGLPQMKLSWLVVSGPAEACTAAHARLEVIADTYLSAGTPVQLALPRLLAAGAEVRAQIQERVLANRRLLDEAVTAHLPAHVLPAEGGWYAILHLPAFLNEEALALELLDEDDVIVQPGYFYDLPLTPALVLSLLAPPAMFAAGLTRLVGRIRDIVTR